MLSAIAGVEEFRDALRALGSPAPDRPSALRRVATLESNGSSTRMSGGKLSGRGVQRLFRDLDIGVGMFGTRDDREVAGYAAVQDTVSDALREIRATKNHIRQLCRDFLQHITEDECRRGGPREAFELSRDP